MRKALTGVTALLLAALATYGAFYLGNAAPSVPHVGTADVGDRRPFVVKLHARWCPVCMATKSVWSEIEREYSTRVRLVVFDFTDEAATGASRAEATRLGLREFFDEYEGATGTSGVLDARTRTAVDVIHGSRDIADYRRAIDVALKQASTARK